MSGLTTTDRDVSYTSAFSKVATKGDFRVRLDLDGLDDVEKIFFRTKEEYDNLPVRLLLLSSAMELPDAKSFVPAEATTFNAQFSVGRNRANHPEDKMISTQITIQAFTNDGELIGEDMVNLVG